MRIVSISATNFLGLASATVDLDRDLTTVTGPNSAGKSTLVKCLALVQDAVRGCAHGTIDNLDSAWAMSGHDDATAFEVRVAVRFDRPDERGSIDAYYRAAVLRMLHPEVANVQALTTVVDGQLGPEPAAAMMTGELVVRFDVRQRMRWTVGWQFAAAHGPAHVQLWGPDVSHLVDGPVAAGRPSSQYLNELCPSSNDIVEKVVAGQVPTDLITLVAGRRIEFIVQAINDSVQPPAIETVLAESSHRSGIQDRIPFARILHRLLGRRLQITDNHRAAIRTEFTLAELATAPNLQDGSLVAVELHRLKNGPYADRCRYAAVQAFFTRLTGRHIDCVVEHLDPAADGREISLVPSIQIQVPGGEPRDIPLRHAGAGDTEALWLATILAGEDRTVFIDEPAVHLAPATQRRLLTLLQKRRGGLGQLIWVTHNPDLVSAATADDLAGIVRMTSTPTGTDVRTLAVHTVADVAAMTRLLISSEVRSLLFAAGVVLCEGPTDLAVIKNWCNTGVTLDGRPLPTPDEQHVVFLTVDGQNSFGGFVKLAQLLGVPWAIVADGPALRPGSTMAGHLESLGHPVPRTGDLLADVRDAWAAHGVYTLADVFGDDRSKAGEIEAFLERVDPAALAQARKDVGARKGTRVGAAFADGVKPPHEIATLWASLLATLVLSA